MGDQSPIVAGSQGQPRPDAVRAAAKAYHNFVHVNTDELLRELLQIAYMSEEPTKRTRKGVPERRDAERRRLALVKSMTTSSPST